MHVRQVAWLHAQPKTAGGKPGNTSRMQSMQQRGAEPALPDPGPAAHVAGYLFEAGPVSSGGMGPAVLSWGDLRAWAESTCTPVQPWEAQLMRRASSEYLAELHAAEAPDRPAPWADVAPTAERRADISARLGSLFGGKARAQPARHLGA